jgi:hypothetical protein
MRKAVLIPCSPLQSCQLIELPDEPNHLGRLAELVGEEPENRSYDPDTVVYTSAGAQSLNRARNERASRYAFAQSAAAKERGMDPGTRMNALPAFLYGRCRARRPGR